MDNIENINYTNFIEGLLDTNNPIFQDLLAISDDKTALYICHPKHIFNKFIENDKTKQLEQVNWNSLNLKKLLRKKDFGYFTTQNIDEKKNQFTYINKKSTHMMESFIKMKIPEVCYPFTILEEKTINKQKFYSVRGIINCYQDGFEIAYNPAFKIIKSNKNQIKR